jgi:hypothetical protein
MYARTLELAHEHQQKAFNCFATAVRAEQRGSARFAELMEEQAERHALLAAEYYTEAECHDWSKRG